MTDSLQKGIQNYKLYKHEFEKVNPRKKTGLSFSMKVHQGRPVDQVKISDTARDLLVVLQHSETAMELMEEHTFKIELDKDFHLSIKEEETQAA
jgi:hypothetical protein